MICQQFFHYSYTCNEQKERSAWFIQGVAIYWYLICLESSTGCKMNSVWICNKYPERKKTRIQETSSARQARKKLAQLSGYGDKRWANMYKHIKKNRFSRLSIHCLTTVFTFVVLLWGESFFPTWELCEYLFQLPLVMFTEFNVQQFTFVVQVLL